MALSHCRSAAQSSCSLQPQLFRARPRSTSPLVATSSCSSASWPSSHRNINSTNGSHSISSNSQLPSPHCDYCVSAPQNVDSERLGNLPKRIILVRHGESEGNIDVTAYTRIPDRRIQLTPEGMRQAEEAGLRVLQVADGAVGCGEEASEEGATPESFFVYVSPYDRSKQTLQVTPSRQAGKLI